MANFKECEKQVIDKLISAFSNTLNCYPSKNDDSEVLEKILQILLEQNNTLFDNQSSGDMRSILDDDEFVLSSSGVSELSYLSSFLKKTRIIFKIAKKFGNPNVSVSRYPITIHHWLY